MPVTTVGTFRETCAPYEIHVEIVADPNGNESIAITRYEGADDDMPTDSIDIEIDQLDDLIRLLNLAKIAKLAKLTAEDLKEMVR